MHLLEIRWARLAAVVLAAGLLLASAALTTVPAADDTPQSPPPQAQPSGDDTDKNAKDSAAGDQDQSADDEDTGAKDEAPEAQPTKPRTEAEERQYKLLKAQNDPFLLDQLNGELRKPPPEFYDPLKSVLPVGQSDLSRYLVQDNTGAVLGHLEIGVELDPDGKLLQLEIRNELPPPTAITVVATADTLDALTTERKLLRLGRPSDGGESPDPDAPSVSPMQDPPRTKVTYSYDRITIKHEQGGVMSHVRLRELPFSFDRDLLPLLIRQVDYQNITWPFEAVATDTAQLKSLPLALDKPQRVTVMSAEPKSYYCFQAELRVGSEVSTWWVEQVPPHRLVKFSMQGLTYTLERYVGK